MTAGRPIKAVFWLMPSNLERIWTASALQGENKHDALNRAIEFYDEVHRLGPPHVTGRLYVRRRLQTMSWTAGDGEPRRIARIE